MDKYFKKQIIYPFAGRKFTFAVAETLFSTFAIDHGTDFLIRNITTANPETILDLGCGYGPIGIVLAAKYAHSQVTMLDRDLLAVRYTEVNISTNNISNARSLASIGVDAVQDQTFDLIVANIPAKIPDEAISEEFIQLPFQHLNPGGELWIVVVNALNRLIPKITLPDNKKMTEVKKRSGHTIYKITKPTKKL